MNNERNLERLVLAVQELSLARDLQQIADTVRHAARALVAADGATFVLRDGDQCHYRDEDAIAPLWKGLRFPMETCISGWAMLNREPALIEDIYLDPRIPHDAYRPTFVKSLVMVPIRSLAPVGAIGVYWAQPYRASEPQVRLLQALADSTSVAMENVQLYAELEQRVAARTQALAEANRLLYEEACQRKSAEEEVLRQSLTDELTGLYNRRGFLLLAGRELEAARRRNSRCLLLYADLDNLKQHNDQLGHAAGDALLVEAAQALRALFRKTDVVARLGGDEFVVLATDYRSVDEVLERLRDELRRGGERLSMSVGVAESAGEGELGLAELLIAADAEMYRNKRRLRR